MADLTALQRDVLFAVAGRDSPNGQEVRRELVETQGRDVLSGHIYIDLGTLVDAGLVEKGARDGRSNEYALTTDGEAWVADRLAWERAYVAVDEVVEP
ncbi:PadR family transcriptional regulator [Halobacterium yunchengense]|uniref:PadR family transcriptional regulator n=1 Tax=Halobacterium yunchengense TaxID=3108497 RepID=UPI0030092921